MQSPLPQQQQAAPAIVSTFPAPPPFYQLFTDSASAVPPPKPIVGQFQMFGKSWTTDDIMPTLEAEGRKQVYDANRTTQEELKRLNKSILHKFLELLDFLVNDPEHANSKVEELELLFVNFHYLLNGYRTHQGRQTMISWLEEQLERRSKALDNIRQLLSEARTTVGESSDLLARYQQEIQNVIATEQQQPQQMNVVDEKGMKFENNSVNNNNNNLGSNTMTTTTTNSQTIANENEIGENNFSTLLKLKELANNIQKK